jgi:hypothetical protein
MSHLPLMYFIKHNYYVPPPDGKPARFPIPRPTQVPGASHVFPSPASRFPSGRVMGKTWDNMGIFRTQVGQVGPRWAQVGQILFRELHRSAGLDNTYMRRKSEVQICDAIDSTQICRLGLQKQICVQPAVCIPSYTICRLQILAYLQGRRSAHPGSARICS